eukprot:13044025-Ditylum_brightwellii.AAC.1
MHTALGSHWLNSSNVYARLAKSDKTLCIRVENMACLFKKHLYFCSTHKYQTQQTMGTQNNAWQLACL